MPSFTIIPSTDEIIPYTSKTINYSINSSYIYQQCKYYHYYDSYNNYICTSNFSCPVEYPKLLKDKNECIKNKEIKNLIQDVIKNEKNETISKEEEIKYYDTIMKKIEEEFTSGILIQLI